MRVELRGLETLLQQHPAIFQAVVVVREKRRGDSPPASGESDKHLVAYVVPTPASALTIEAIYRYLKERIPEYMLPTALMILEQLPLTPNGKVDRKALPALESGRPNLETAYVPPRTSLEEILVDLWAQVLRVERVGVYDNFFELGGHSLLATQLVSRIRETLHIELPLRAIFEAPTVVGLSQRTPSERESLIPVLHAGPRPNELPLSFAQERLWFLDQLEPGNAAYNVPTAVWLQGTLKVEALEQSLNELIRRHEVLRTTFRPVAGRPIQIIRPSQGEGPPTWLPCVDLSTLPENARQAEGQRLTKSEAARPFDLERGPLIRTCLLRSAPDEHLLLLTLHHIISDGWSTGILIREISSLYFSFADGHRSPLPELAVQYADYALWQRAWLTGLALEQQVDYWKRQLADAPSTLELPTDYPRPRVQTFNGATLSFKLPAALSTHLAALEASAGITLFMKLFAAFTLLLHRYSGQTVIVVGSPIANRTRGDIEGLIGFFVNTLALRVDFASNPTFPELIRQVRETCLEAYAHQDLPFEKLVEEIQVRRDLSHHPVFQVLFVLQNAPLAPLDLPGLALKPLASENSTAKFDLAMSLIETPDGLIGQIEYATSLYRPETIEQLAGNYQTLLESILAEPGQRTSELGLLTPLERQQLLGKWNATEVTSPETYIHVLIERQAAQTPEAVAVVFESQHLTYQAIHAQSNRLAHRLIQLGVGPEVRVGVILDRSPEIVIALWGILKAGGAYVPLDPAYPPERLKFMLADSGVKVLLTQSWRLADGWPLLLSQANTSQREAEGVATTCKSPSVICLDLETDWPILHNGQELIPDLQSLTPDNLAYLIYTSGSTGQPKGVMVVQRGIPNMVQAQLDSFGVNANSRVLQFSSLSFDASIFEIFMTLVAGASLCLGTPDSLAPGLTLAKLLSEQHITTALLPPSALALIPSLPLPALQTLIVGGEACLPDLVARWATDRHFYNAYGPTETTVWVTMAECLDNHQRPPIGRPISNTQVYLLDEHLNPVPRGVVGEIYLGGIGLARGYLGQPDLTAEKFVPNPFLTTKDEGRTTNGVDPSSLVVRPSSGLRLYRTGDLARYRFDGNLEFLGRIDHQVKIRGFRIELGEIEAALTQYSSVRQAIVLAQNDSLRGPSLVAYVVTDHPDSFTPGNVRQFLHQRLPEYMIPSAFVTLAALPLTPNGKVDRKALPAPPGERPNLEMAYVPPRTPAEEILAGLWAQVLGMERVGIYDNFFELGGHSLLATQLISRIRQVFQIEVSLRAVFETPDVARLVERLETVGRTAGPPIQPASRGNEREPSLGAGLPLSSAQQRLWFLDQLEPGNPAYNTPAALRLSGTLNVAALARSIIAIIQRHEVLRTRFITRDGQPIQVIAQPRKPEWPFALALTPILPVVDLRQLPAAERDAQVQQLAVEAARHPFDLAHGPVVRANLLQVMDNDYVLLLNAHHIVFDGWSVGVLVRELNRLYRAFMAGQPAALPELPVQYADYALWEQHSLQETVGEQQLAYWRAQLAGLSALNLPTDRPRPLIQSYRGATVRLELPPGLTTALHRLGQEEGATLFMVLLAAFQALLARYTGQADIAVGTPVANRTRAEVEGLIGFFVNTLVLRTDLSGNPSFQEIVKRTRQVALGAYAHQDLPFEKLVTDLQPERDLSRSPLFQVMFVLQNTPEAALELPGLQLQPLEVKVQTTQFDLTLSLSNTPVGLIGHFEYATDLFDAQTIGRLAEHYRILLEGSVAEAQLPLSRLPLFSASESQKLIKEWNATEAIYPRTCVPALFEAQAAQAPEAVALVMPADRTGAIDSPHHLTYGELNRRAGQLASYLQKQGVGPEVTVGICIERSLDMIIGWLGILKAGGAYVPLDPNYPAERQTLMLKDAQASILITQSWLAAKAEESNRQVSGERSLATQRPALASSQRSITVCLDKDWDMIANGELPTAVPQSLATPDNLAYVIYTSGSTGKPKGVMVNHTSLANAYQAWEAAYKLGPTNVHLQMANMAFDVFTGDVVRALCSGGRLVLSPAEWLLEPEKLYTLLREQAVDSAEFVPVVLRPLVNYVEQSGKSLAFMRLLIVGSDVWQVNDQRAIQRLGGTDTRHINSYGVTEATIDSAFFEGSVTELTDEAGVPIGRPLANVRAYILDDQLQPAPIGAVGELYLSGAGLARGYRGQPDLTAERFVPNPFLEQDEVRTLRVKDENGSGDSFILHAQRSREAFRLYKTGDLARYQANGVIELLGRADSQVKIRGYRIELSEIEAILRSHAAVREAAVTVWEPPPGNPHERGRRLVAYLSLYRPEALRGNELRRYLSERLPEYMLPSRFVPLTVLPLTASGKVDRNALPKLDQPWSGWETVWIAPQTPTEEQLARIWADLLGVERIGAQDNFFDQGGDSLMVMRVVAKANQAGLKLTPKQIFQHPTLAELAVTIEPVQIYVEPSLVTRLANILQPRTLKTTIRRCAEMLKRLF